MVNKPTFRRNVSPFADFSTLKMEAILSSETSAYSPSTQHNIPEDDIVQSQPTFRRKVSPPAVGFRRTTWPYIPEDKLLLLSRHGLFYLSP
jgi:hypothetical protein